MYTYVHVCVYVCVFVCVSMAAVYVLETRCVSALSALMPHPSYDGNEQPFPTIFAYSSIHVLDVVYNVHCYVYSLPPCYFTQSALPIYQTGCCSVCYTCDLSRVTDCARCRFVCTAVTHL